MSKPSQETVIGCAAAIGLVILPVASSAVVSTIASSLANTDQTVEISKPRNEKD